MYTGERAWLAEKTPFEQAVWGLFAPLTETEANPPPITQETFNAAKAWETKEFTGATYGAAAQAFNDYAIAHEFSDGLPLVVPTPELVEEMLQATTRDRNEVLGMFKMRGGIITIEKIAINAVMAGAKPEYLPVIIAAMEAYATGWEFDKMWYHPMTSGGPFNLGVVISGPLGAELGFNVGTGWAGAANPANNLIGRAFRMCIRNIGQNTTPRIDTTNRTGRLYDHTLLTFAENEAYLPEGWKNHSAMMGFQEDQSTVTLFGFVGSMTGYGDESYGVMDSLRSSRENVSTNANFVIFPPATAWAAQEDYGLNSKEAVREWYATHNATGGTTARSAGIYGATHILVVGTDPGSVLNVGGFMLYGQTLVYQTQLISGATLTEGGRDATVPSTPENFVVDYVYDEDGVAIQAVLTWEEPLSDGGMPITGYQVNWIHGGNRQTAPWTAVPGGADARTFTVNLRPAAGTYFTYPNLVDRKNDTWEFFFKVRATNGVLNAAEISGNNITRTRVSGRGAWAMNPVVFELLSVTPEAFVTKQNGNKNLLTIKITEYYSDKSTVVFEEEFQISNNAAGTYEVGPYLVYVDTKGNDQIRQLYIVE